MGTLGLPEAFLERMQRMLGTEYDAFLNSYEKERSYGFRRNPLKSEAEEFEHTTPFTISRVVWAEEGYFCPKEEQPGKHVLHEAGAYYIQEPSAMAVADLLKAKPGECIADLCAAPGGKSTQLAGKLRGEGLLISNEIVPNRARILSQNIERFGVRNCVVLNENTAQMAEQFPLFFHGMIVDAPCSGEGMFRKNDQACSEWSPQQVSICAERQLEILENADKMLAPGGRMIYSTCTFAPEENEGVLVRFLRKHPEYRLMELPCYEGMEHGRAEWVVPFGGVPDFDLQENEAFHVEYSLRLWPHRISGEGHFIAGLCKEGDLAERSEGYRRVCAVESAKNGKKGKNGKSVAKGVKGAQAQSVDILSAWKVFEQEVLGADVCDASAMVAKQSSGVLVAFGEHLYLVPEQMRDLTGLKVERAGLELGEWKKNRFEPAHALALALQPKDVKQTYAMTKEEADRYIRGEAIPCGNLTGWVLMSYEGYSVGWAKASGGMAKNHYPKGLRIQG